MTDVRQSLKQNPPKIRATLPQVLVIDPDSILVNLLDHQLFSANQS